LEATAINLYQETALDQLAAVDPKPLVIVSLRCPAAQIRSSFFYHRAFGRIDPSLDFPTFATELLQAGSLARLAAAIPDGQLRTVLESAMTWNRYVEWLDLWSQRFPTDRMMVLTLDQVVNAPAATLKGICTRIGIDGAFYDAHDLPRLNEGAAGRVKDPNVLWRVGRRIVPAGRIRTIVANWDRRRRMGPPVGPPTDVEETVLNALGERFQPFSEDLALRFGIDTSGWRPHGSVRLSTELVHSRA
jgi:hypothetical protein